MNITHAASNRFTASGKNYKGSTPEITNTMTKPRLLAPIAVSPPNRKTPTPEAPTTFSRADHPHYTSFGIRFALVSQR